MWRDGQWRWGEGSAHLMNSHWRLFMLWRVKKKYYIRGGNRSVVTVQAAANGIDQVEEMKMKDTLITQWTPSTPVSLLLEQKHMIINYSHISFPSRMTKQAVTTLKSVTNSVTFIYFRTFLLLPLSQNIISSNRNKEGTQITTEAGNRTESEREFYQSWSPWSPKSKNPDWWRSRGKTAAHSRELIH